MDHVPALQGRRILVIEDDYGVSQAITLLLEGEGAEVIGPVGWADEALALIESQGTTLDAALLDIDLHGEGSYAIADALASRGVRFAFATGYSGEAIAPAYRDVPRCQKPFKVEDLIKALSTPRA
jgi:CheY-like chemotaxis protein